MEVLWIDDLPDEPGEAAAQFYAEYRPRIASLKASPITLVLPPADHRHADWRRAAVRDLARELAPARINMVAGQYGAAMDRTLAYLRTADGITGQSFETVQD